MSSLEKRIKQVEADIVNTDAYINEQVRSLEEDIPPKTALVAIGTSVLVGFLVARKKSVLTLVRQGAILFFRAKMWTRKIKRFLPY